MKGKISLIFSLLACFVFGQKTTILSGSTLFVAEGTTVKFDAVDSQGTLKVRAKTTGTNLVIDGEITGDENLVLSGSLVNIKLDNCSWNVSNAVTDTVHDVLLNANSRIVLEPGIGLQTEGDFSDQSNLDPSIRIKADASGYGQFHLIGSYTKSGTGVASKETFFSANETWRQLGATLQGVSGLSLSQWADDVDLYFSDADPELQNVFLWDGSPAGKSSPYQLDATGWVAATVNQTIDKTQTGTIYLGPSSILYTVNTNHVSESGDIQTSSETYNLFYTEDDEEGKDVANEPDDYYLLGGWNLLHNPYTANLSLTKLFDYGGSNAWPLAYPYVHVWDPVIGQYKALTNGGSVASIIEYNNSSSDAVTTSDLTIAPGQGFWVKTINVSGLDENGDAEGVHENSPNLTTPLTISRDYLDIGGVPQNFFKNQPPHIRLATIRLNDSAYDQTVVLFDENSEESGDAKDAFKLRTVDKTKPTLFSQTANELELSINALPNSLEYYRVPIHFESADDIEDYYFKVDLSDINPNWVIEIEDKATQKIVDVSNNGEFVFTHFSGVESNRFVLHINSLGIPLPANYHGDFYRTISLKGSSLSIHQNSETQYRVDVYSVTGRLLKTVDNLNEHHEMVSLNEVAADFIIVAVSDAVGTKSSKFFLRRE